MVSRRVLGLAVLPLLLGAGLARAASPTVLHSPSDDGVPHPMVFQIGLPGSHDLHLWVETGSTPSVPAEEVCLDGSGDEICALQLDIATTGGVSIVSFTPDPAIAATLTWNLVDPTFLRINRVQATGGDFGALRIGELVVDRPTEGDVIVAASSTAVTADLAKVAPMGSPIAVPEPDALVLLLPALGLLALERYRRTRWCSCCPRSGCWHSSATVGARQATGRARRRASPSFPLR